MTKIEVNNTGIINRIPARVLRGMDILNTVFTAICIVLCIMLSNCSTSPRFTTRIETVKPDIETIRPDKAVRSEKHVKSQTLFIQEGIASYYGDKFHGRKTANGEIFDMNNLSAAHRTAPLGSVAIVTNLNNNKSIRLRINDRGPFISGRILDVSKRVAQELDFIKEGTTKIRLEVIKIINE